MCRTPQAPVRQPYAIATSSSVADNSTAGRFYKGVFRAGRYDGAEETFGRGSDGVSSEKSISQVH